MLPSLSRGALWYSISSSNNEYVAIYHSPTRQGYYASNVFINIPSNHLRVASGTDYPWAERSAAQKFIMNYPASSRWFNTTNHLWEFNTGFDTNPPVAPSPITEDVILSGKTLSGSITNPIINPGVISNALLALDQQSGRLANQEFIAGQDSFMDWTVSGFEAWTGVGTWGHTVTGVTSALVYQEIGCYGFVGEIVLETRPYGVQAPTNEMMCLSCSTDHTNKIGFEISVPMALIGSGLSGYEHRFTKVQASGSVSTSVLSATWVRGWE